MIEFKPLILNDIEAVVKLMIEFYTIDNYPIDPEISKNLFEEFITNEHLGKVWGIYLSDEMVGYTILTFVFSFEYQGKIAFLDELYLSEKARGKGIGQQVVDFIKTESHKLSLKLIYLEVEEHNLKAQNLYLAHGFKFHNRKIMRFKTS